MVPLGGIVFAELLAGEELNHFASSKRRFFDGLKHGELIERVSLATNEKASSLVFVRDFIFSAGWAVQEERQGKDCWQGKLGQIHKQLLGVLGFLNEQWREDNLHSMEVNFSCAQVRRRILPILPHSSHLSHYCSLRLDFA